MGKEPYRKPYVSDSHIFLLFTSAPQSLPEAVDTVTEAEVDAKARAEMKQSICEELVELAEGAI